LNYKKSNFLIRKVHSLLAIIPMGLFIILHITLNSSVFYGGITAYKTVINVMQNIPLITEAEIIIIAIPIIFHAIYGLWIVYLAKNNVLTYTYYRNWAFYLQRITAVITLIYLLFHVAILRFLNHDASVIISVLNRTLQNPLFFILYVIGVLSAIYHFTNGIFSFLISWGVIVNDKSQKVLQYIVLLLFVLLGGLSVGILGKITYF